MNKVLFEKLKSNIQVSILSSFILEEVDENHFIPIDIKNNVFYAAVSDTSDKNKISDYIKDKLDVETKFLPVELDVFVALYNYIKDQFKYNKNSSDAPKKRIGELLIESGHLSEKNLEDALAYSKENQMPIGSALVQLGFVTIETLKSALEKQQGFQSVNAEQLKLDVETLNLLPEEFIKSNMVLPISTDGRTIVVGMVNPNEKRILNEIVYLTGLQPRVMLITYVEFQSCISAYFNKTRKETTKIIQKLEEESVHIETEEALWQQVEKDIQDSSGTVADFANRIIATGIEMRASDIHIEPRLARYVVRYRVDGILQEVFELPQKVELSIITRFKVLSRMDIAEHRRPQDGTFTMSLMGKKYDFRINTLPVSNREKMVIRILAPAMSMENQDRSLVIDGMNDEEFVTLKKMTTRPNGIILAAGPTGSGKTTTLYKILVSLNSPTVNITTIEDPVEIKIDGINQSQVNPKAGITFASCMRSILRQDPDIILVGEIRDFETLETAISASLTGHLVLSTIHTNSAAATVTRLIEMGAKGYLVASTLTGVIAQRLVRKLCPVCREKYTPSHDELNSIMANEYSELDMSNFTFYKPKGCPVCNQEGYNGRIGIFEILPITKEIKRLIAQGAHDIEIEEAAIANGMMTLEQNCLSHILRGETTIEEFVRVLGMAGD
ncbi:Flp pilus assembly complex ATPase component TadA [bacterium]|nr:Flp pilus assembly complex ATPase component TadA [bacterium]